jgi:hypothetical protein
VVYINWEHKELKQQILVHRKSSCCHQVPLQHYQVRMLCEITTHTTRGSFFDTTINFKQYVRPILVPFLDQLTEKENSYGPFMEGNAIVCKQLMVLWVRQLFLVNKGWAMDCYLPANLVEFLPTFIYVAHKEINCICIPLNHYKECKKFSGGKFIYSKTTTLPCVCKVRIKAENQHLMRIYVELSQGQKNGH